MNKSLKKILLLFLFFVIAVSLSIHNKLLKENNNYSVEHKINIENLTGDYAFRIEKPFEFSDFIQKKKPLIVDYGADYCPPCRELMPILEKLNKEMTNKAFIKVVDVDKHKSLVKIPIRCIPTQVFFNADGSPFLPSKNLNGKLRFNFINQKGTEKHLLTLHEGFITEENLRAILKEMGVE